MKYLSFFLLLGILFFQCRSNYSAIDQTITISGKVLGVDEPFLLHYSTNYDYGRIEYQDHAFQFKIDSDVPVLITCQYRSDKWDIFAEPGDSIHLEFDHFDFVNFGESLVYSGDKISENRALLALKESLHYGEGSDSQFYFEPENAFVGKMIDLCNESEDVLTNQILHQDNFSSLFKEWASAYVYYAQHLHFEQYCRFKKSAGKEVQSVAELISSANICLMAPEQSFKKDKSLLALPPYRSYIFRSVGNDLYDVFVKDSFSTSTFNWIANGLKIIDQRITNPELKEGAKFHLFRTRFASYGFTDIESEIDQFLQQARDKKHISIIQRAMKEWEGLTKNNPAPKFALPDVEGSIQTLDHFKGKYLYIDVWATWCSPCLKEHPHFEKLVTRYKENPNLAFVGISTDINPEAWKNMILREEFKGIQLLAGQDSLFREDYKITSIPHFILIDKEGKMMDYRAPRPSSEEIVGILDNLVQL